MRERRGEGGGELVLGSWSCPVVRNHLHGRSQLFPKYQGQLQEGTDMQKGGEEAAGKKNEPGRRFEH